MERTLLYISKPNSIKLTMRNVCMVLPGSGFDVANEFIEFFVNVSAPSNALPGLSTALQVMPNSLPNSMFLTTIDYAEGYTEIINIKKHKNRDADNLQVNILHKEYAVKNMSNYGLSQFC